MRGSGLQNANAKLASVQPFVGEGGICGLFR